jgi:hypothetical protein
MSQAELRREALKRQGSQIAMNGRILQVSGGSSVAEFLFGREGLVQLAIDKETGQKYRIKCFWEPDERRLRRSEHLVNQCLANLNKNKADALGGAPIAMLSNLGHCTPFALVMRNVRGESWDKLKQRAQLDPEYPPRWWPPANIRATWAYGLATAVWQMEEKQFIHSDVSRGNVVVSDGIHGVLDTNGNPSLNDEFAGDMALVDFDRFIHGQVEPPDQGKGSKGYAAKEVWDGKRPELGSDRTSMAILIQEFLVTGDSNAPREQVFDWIYDQDRQTFGVSSSGQDSGTPSLFRVHPLLSEKYPVVAQLVEETVRAFSPLDRPEPQKWRDALRPVADPTPAANRSKLLQLTVEEVTTNPNPYRRLLGQAMRRLNLEETDFNIRACLKRDEDGSIFLFVNHGASIEVKQPGSDTWTTYAGNARVDAKNGTEVRDKNGLMTVRLLAPR